PDQYFGLFLFFSASRNIFSRYGVGLGDSENVTRLEDAMSRNACSATEESDTPSRLATFCAFFFTSVCTRTCTMVVVIYRNYIFLIRGVNKRAGTKRFPRLPRR